MFVWSVIWINSTETNGGISSGFFAIKGKLTTAIRITEIWNKNDISKFYNPLNQLMHNLKNNDSSNKYKFFKLEDKL